MPTKSINKYEIENHESFEFKINLLNSSDHPLKTCFDILVFLSFFMF